MDSRATLSRPEGEFKKALRRVFLEKSSQKLHETGGRVILCGTAEHSVLGRAELTEHRVFTASRLGIGFLVTILWRNGVTESVTFRAERKDFIQAKNPSKLRELHRKSYAQ